MKMARKDELNPPNPHCYLKYRMNINIGIEMLPYIVHFQKFKKALPPKRKLKYSPLEIT